MAFRRLFWLFTSLVIMASLLITSCTGNSGDQVRTELVTVPVIITATTDPDVTPNVIIITATLDRTQVAVPDDFVPESSGTLNAPQFTTELPDSDSSSDSGVPVECLIHIVDDGDTIFGLAEIYGVNPFRRKDKVF